MRRRWAGCLVLSLLASSAFADESQRWLPVPAEPAVSLGVPSVSLGVPRAATKARGSSPDDGGFRTTYWASEIVSPAPDGALVIAPVQAPEASSVPPPPPPASSTSEGLFYVPPPPHDRDRDPPKKKRRHESRSFGDYVHDMFQNEDGGRCMFESDHCFDEFSSPVTNTFLAEDPRSLTEIRPIFLYQIIPNNNPQYRGGSALFYGTQLRLALTERWSVVVNKLGGATINSGGGSAVENQSSFAEFWIGPKWTFLRNEDSRTLGAAGVTFQLPSGTQAGQNTGSLSVAPYLTFGQHFGQTSFGAFNVINTLGYAFRTDNTRSEYFYNTFHIDYDVACRNKIFPFVELNWLYYTRSGKALPYDFEGADFANFGSQFVDGRNNLNLAVGMRYKFSECIQTGVAAEFPLVGTRDLQQFRLTIDFIFRY